MPGSFCVSIASSKDNTVKATVGLRAAGERLRALLPAKGGPSRESLFYVEFGSVAEKIVRVAVENNADLIVLGIATAGASAAHLAEGDAYKVVGGCSVPGPHHPGRILGSSKGTRN